MQEVWPYLSAMWTTLALLAGGYARTRNRSALAWFVLTMIFGPFAAFFLVVLLPVATGPETHPAETHPAATRSAETRSVD